MRIYTGQTVYAAAVERMEWIFSEFKNVVINVSGGKDSTVVLNIALQVAERLGRLPLPVYFLDQEAEWDCVIDYMRTVMSDPRVKPLWFQIPFKIFNAASSVDQWLECWKPGADWIRPKEPDSIHDNVMGCDRFAEMFAAFGRTYYPNEPMCHVAGVRAEESPARLNGLTSYPTYKWVTWGKVEDKARDHYAFYPIFDWTYKDVWTAIHHNKWQYCKLYDYMYQYGIPVFDMRVSNVHHKTAIKTLTFLQEIEPDTWNRITERLASVNAVNQAFDVFRLPSELPWMFKDWYEYRDYLLEKLVTDPDNRERMRRQFKTNDDNYDHPMARNVLLKTQISAILANDWHGTKLSTFHARFGRYAKNRGSRNFGTNLKARG